MLDEISSWLLGMIDPEDKPMQTSLTAFCKASLPRVPLAFTFTVFPQAAQFISMAHIL